MGGIDWTDVIVVGVPAYIAAFCAGVAAIMSARNRRSLRTPSGDPIGEVVERAHDLTATNAALLTRMHKRGAGNVAPPDPSDILTEPAKPKED